MQRIEQVEYKINFIAAGKCFYCFAELLYSACNKGFMRYQDEVLSAGISVI